MADKPTRDNVRSTRLFQDGRDNQDSEPVAYIDQEGNIRLWQGDEVAPWVKIANPASDPVNVNIVSGGGGGGMVEGFTAHDAADPGTENPVYLGGYATAAPRAPVSADGDRAGASTDLESRQRVRVSGKTGNQQGAGNDADVPLDPNMALTVAGTVNHDAPLVSGFPLIIGANAFATPQFPVGDGDAVRASADREGRFRSRVSGMTPASVATDVPLDPAAALAVGGPIAAGAAYAGYPVMTGGIALDEAPAAVDIADVARFWSDLFSRLQVNHQLAFAGENLLYDYKRSLIAPAPFEQDSLLSQSIIATGAVSAITLKAAAGRLYRVFALNTSGAVAYLQVRNATGTGAPTMSALAIPTGSSGSIDFGNFGRYMDTGITVQLSSTQSTYTAINMGATGCHLTGDYI